jgi:hypothetical protein
MSAQLFELGSAPGTAPLSFFCRGRLAFTPTRSGRRAALGSLLPPSVIPIPQRRERDPSALLCLEPLPIPIRERTIATGVTPSPRLFL